MKQPKPDMKGVARAWRIDPTAEHSTAHAADWGYDHSGIATWIVNGPYHPFWSWWMVAVVHLRPVPGAPPANKHYPEAEYEFIVVSIDSPPAGKVTPDIARLRRGDDPADGARGAFLSPPDVVFQFDGVTAERAAKICEDAVHAIVGGVSCDSDYRSWWVQSLARTVEHYHEGLH